MSRRRLPAQALQAPHVLREYALLADGERGVLVGPRGDHAWLCFPAWDSDAVFSTLVGGLGTWALWPTERSVWGGYYEPGSLIWRSRWITEEAVVECREALVLPAATDRLAILRHLIVLEGHALMQCVLNPRAEFGRQPLRRLRRDDDGRWTANTGALSVRLSGGAQAEPVPDGHRGHALVTELDLGEGASHDFVLELGTGELGPPPQAEVLWAQTAEAWKQRIPSFADTAAPRDARHAYAVMRGLTGGGSGMVAAATTSLPERAGEGRSYDYRYVWIRDQCYAGQAVARHGPHGLLTDAVTFVCDRVLEDGPKLMPAYTASGDRVPDERELELPGYPGGVDVVGNHVNAQFQLDAFGEALLLLAAAGRHDMLDADGWRAVEVAADAIAGRWQEPDAGIWELEPQPWAHSRLTCAAGLRGVSELPQSGERAPGWLALADTLVADTAARSVHHTGRWKRAPDDERIDASLLLPALRGAIAPEDPRSLATLHAVEQDLTQDGYAYRFRPDGRPLGEAEGAFLLCGFFLSLAWLQQGDLVRAARWFERNRAACGPPGLLSEEFDVQQRQLRGNLPQAFVHALLLECAVALGGS